MPELNSVTVYDDGDPKTGVRVSQASRWMRPGVILGAITTCVLAMTSMTIMVIYLTPSIDRLTENSKRASTERTDLLDTIETLQNELAKIRGEQLEERLVDDCSSLYLYDIEIAKGIAQVVLGDNLAKSILLGGDNQRLAQEVFDADTQLRNSLDALSVYQAIDPPPEECPHLG